MTDKQLKELPPSYSNLAYDRDPVAGPSAPNTERDPKIAEGVPGPSNAFPQPTAPLPPQQDTPSPGTLFHNPPSLVFENIYEACLRYVDQHCCYGKRFINQMKLTDVMNKTMYHYTLESFGEKREAYDSSSPYKGGSVDGPQNGRPPNVWDISVRQPEPFVDDWTVASIPHTEYVQQCGECRGSGEVTCYSCDGSGEEDCSRCRGSGKVGEENDRCSYCSGSGKERCSNCYGSGKRTCSKCDGHKRVKKYKMVRVTWKNHLRDSMTRTDQLPPELLLDAKGVELFRESAKKLRPIQNAADPDVNMLSRESMHAHKVSFRNEQIIRQRHILRAIPFTQIKYKWKDREGEFYVYGTEEKVYFEHYPQQCCCCTCC